MNIYVIKDKNGNDIKQGDKFTFKFLENPNKPKLNLVGAFAWNQDELRYEIDIYNHTEYTCLYYQSNNKMFDFELIPDAKSFVIERLKDIHKKFDNIKIRYEIDNYDDTHIIEILPSKLYENKKYMDEEIKLIYDFSCRYKEQDIMFISKNSLTEIKKPIFEL